MAGGRIDVIVEPDVRGFGSKLESGLKESSGIAGKIGKGIALALAAGTAAAGFGLSAIIDKGVQYQANLNEMQAVTQATALDMQRVGKVAKDLGADLSLPATSAADAAAAMVELAKGGLSVDQAMKAAKGTLQLAAAAQIGAAQAAEIQSNALNEFGLSADQAGHVADVLANTANAASGSIVDMANALKFVGPAAKGLSINIDNVSAALGLLANNGIKGEQAGTSLRGILASLASPSKAAAKALDELGIKAFDQQGKFVGLRTITDQLAKAKAKLSEADFAAAASTAFGNEGFTAANALANEGAKAFDEMATAVSRAGGAQDVAAAKTKGLGGAIEGFKSQVETAGIGIFEAIAPPLEKAVRAGADAVARLTPAVVRGVETAVAAGEVFGPRLADAIKSRGAVIGSAVHDVLAPVGRTVPDLLNAGINAAIDLWNDFTDVLDNVVDAAKPVANGIAAVAKASVEADGPVSAVAAGLRLAGDAAKFASGILVPIGHLVGGLASAFAALPGPIQTTIIALGLLAAFRNPVSSFGDTVGRVTGSFRALGDEVRLQQALLTGSTDIMSAQVGKVGLAMAALETRVPVLRSIREAFDQGSAGAERFHRTAGIAAAAGTGLKSAAGGIVSAFGGPWGIAIAGAAAGLSFLAGNQQEAAQKAAEHAGWVQGLTQALRNSKGAIDENIRAQIVKKAQDDGALDAAKKLGVAYEDVSRAIIDGGPALDGLKARLQAIVAANTEVNTDSGTTIETLNDTGKTAQFLLGQLDNLSGGFQQAQDKQKQLDDAVRKGNVSMLDATGAGKTLSGAMNVLKDSTASADDRARALKDALDALSGPSLTLEAAQARLHETVDRMNQSLGENLDNTKGYGKELLNLDGSINTVLPNGRRLFDFARDMGEQMANVAQKTFDAARDLGDDIPTALAKAKDASQEARQKFIDIATAMGLSADQASILADHMNLVPSKVETLISAPGMDQTQIELILLRDLVNKVPPDKPIVVRSLSDEAKKKLQELGFIVTTLPDGQVEIIAKDQAARDNFGRFIQDISNKSVAVQVVPVFNKAKLQREIRESALFGARGGIISAFAGGGVARALTPMKGGVATIVAPDTWRIIGDRIRDDEFYIPDNNDPRSLALGMEWARRRGMQLVRQFALGGIAQLQSSRDILTTTRPSVVINGNLELRALSDRFSLQQVNEALYFAGIR